MAISKRSLKTGVLALGTSLMLAASPALAQQGAHEHGDGQRGAAAAHGHPAEPERAPMGYPQVQRPSGADVRPQQFDRQSYNHNFVADHGYHIGPYQAPRGFRYHRWGYGDILPRGYWGPQYFLQDYWLFGLDVPPYGFEWVRYGPDALLIDTRSGEVVQVIYGRFL